MNSHLNMNGIEVQINRIYQMKTYASLLEGTPDKDLNDEILMEIEYRAKNVFSNDAVHILDSRANEDDDFPAYTIILELKAHRTFKKPDFGFSILTVICFQDEFAFPLSSKNKYYLTEIPFELLCKEYDYM